MPALRVGTTTIELRASICTSLYGSEHQGTRTLWANGGTCMPGTQGIKMRIPSCPCFWECALPERLRNGSYLSIREKGSGETLDVGCVPCQHHVTRHNGLEFAFTPEHHQRVELVLFNLQEFRKCLKVPVVLSQGVLNSVLAAWPNNGPLRRLLISKNPAINIFCLYDKDAVSGNDDVINLRSSILRQKGQIVQGDIDRFVEKSPMGCRPHRFTDPSFNCIEYGHEYGSLVSSLRRRATFSHSGAPCAKRLPGTYCSAVIPDCRLIFGRSRATSPFVTLDPLSCLCDHLI